MSLVNYKKFNMHVVTPHEALMALQPETFEWECKVVTDYNLLLDKIQTEDKDANCEDILNHEYSSDS